MRREKFARAQSGGTRVDFAGCAKTPPLRNEAVLSNIGLVTLAVAGWASVAAAQVLSEALAKVNTHFAQPMDMFRHVLCLSGIAHAKSCMNLQQPCCRLQA
jgi:hypothetical protein